MELPRSFINTSLLFTKEKFARLEHSKIGIVGIGGVGSWAAEALVRSGVQNLVLIDPDNVFESNINRQSQASHLTLGLAKVDASERILLTINPRLAIKKYEDHLSESTADLILSQENACFWIDACDDLKAKIALIMALKRRKNIKSLLICGAVGGKTNPQAIHTSDLAETKQDPLLAKLRYQLRKKFQFPKQGKMNLSCVSSSERMTPNNTDVTKSGKISCSGYGSIVTVTATMGMLAASEAIKKLTY